MRFSSGAPFEAVVTSVVDAAADDAFVDNAEADDDNAEADDDAEADDNAEADEAECIVAYDAADDDEAEGTDSAIAIDSADGTGCWSSSSTNCRWTSVRKRINAELGCRGRRSRSVERAPAAAATATEEDDDLIPEVAPKVYDVKGLWCWRRIDRSLTRSTFRTLC